VGGAERTPSSPASILPKVVSHRIAQPGSGLDQYIDETSVPEHAQDAITFTLQGRPVPFPPFPGPEEHKAPLCYVTLYAAGRCLHTLHITRAALDVTTEVVAHLGYASEDQVVRYLEGLADSYSRFFPAEVAELCKKANVPRVEIAKAIIFGMTAAFYGWRCMIARSLKSAPGCKPIILVGMRNAPV